jgi:hypothetical protein
VSLVADPEIPNHYYAHIEWIDEEGYRVIGDFALIGWSQPPRAVGERVMKILSKPPKVLYYGRPRDRAGNQPKAASSVLSKIQDPKEGQMAVKYVCKNGMEVRGPPYTKAEEAEFYSRLSHGPVTMYAPTKMPPKPRAQAPASKPTAKKRGSDR